MSEMERAKANLSRFLDRVDGLDAHPAPREACAPDVAGIRARLEGVADCLSSTARYGARKRARELAESNQIVVADAIAAVAALQAEREALTQALGEAQQERDRLTSLVEAAEWMGDSDGWVACPWCNEQGPSGHHIDCPAFPGKGPMNDEDAQPPSQGATPDTQEPT